MMRGLLAVGACYVNVIDFESAERDVEVKGNSARPLTKDLDTPYDKEPSSILG
jgi:hypothetical protein